jgi:glucose-1-phosphate thymidylyltransferase
LGRQLASNFSTVGATICAYQVVDPSEYGVVVFDEQGKATKLVEKPRQHISDWAIPGLYFYDSSVCERVRSLRPSPRGELEITDLNISYLNEGALKVLQLPRGTAWLDLGTAKNLLEASNFVQSLQERQGLLIGSPDEAALVMHRL